MIEFLCDRWPEFACNALAMFFGYQLGYNRALKWVIKEMPNESDSDY